MAIQIDATSTATASGTISTWSHTCTGSSLILWVGIILDGDKATSVTYNGVAMTQLAKTPCDGGTPYIYLYYLANPATGANNIVVNCASSAFISTGAASYDGCRLTGIPDAQVVNTVLSSQTSMTTTLTVGTSNAWMVGIYRNDAGAWTVGTNTTNRIGFTGASNASILADTNGPQAIGSRSMTATCSSAHVAGIVASFAPTTSLFWVGGTSNWDASTKTHWSYVSGGASGANVPTSIDNVFFNGSSGGGTVTVTATSSCKNLDFTGSTQTFTGSSNLSVYGSLTLVAGITYSYSGIMTFASTTTGQTITTAGQTFLGGLVFDGVGGGFTLQDNLTTNNAGTITLTNGSLNFNNKDVTTTRIISSNSNTRIFTLGSGTITLTGSGTPWSFATTTGLTLNVNTSTLKLTDATSSSKTFAGGSKTYNNLWLTGAGTGTFIITGSNTFNDFKCDTPPHTINFTAGTTTTISTFTVNGTAGNLITLQSTSSGNVWYLVKPSTTTISCDYLSLQDSYAI